MITAGKGKVMAAGYLGKVKTVAQMSAIVLLLLKNLPFELYGLPLPISFCGLQLSFR